MAQDKLQRAKETYQDVKEAWRDNHKRMLEDLRFSNPADPQQWDQDALTARQGRVCLTLDRTNQYIVQVVNGSRQNKPAITTVPVDSQGDVEVATAIDGIIRHIEYRSRAAIAYDWALEGAARCGVGWIRVVPKIIDPETNQQEITIQRVPDHLSIVIDGTEPDGSDAMNGFAETLVPKHLFQKEFPKAAVTSWDSNDGTWTMGDYVRVCEHQYIVEKQSNVIVIDMPDGQRLDLSEDEYWDLASQIGYKPTVVGTFMATTREVVWCKFNGNELLEETTFPGRWIGMVPVIGFEQFIEGRRFLCGMTRRLMPGQRAYNYERSAMVEAVAMQPKAPIMVPVEGVAGQEPHWESINTGSPAYLPYNSIDPTTGNPIPRPERLSPPIFPNAFAQGGQLAVSDMEAEIGMNRASIGMPNNATSGRQERERRAQGDTATYHFTDNLSRSIEQVGRIVVGQIPFVMDTKRQAKILGIDGKNGDVLVDPGLPVAAQKRGNKVVAINPGVGTYDVRVTAGPSYTTQREEAADGLTAAIQAAPQFAPVLLPALVKMRDWPEAEKTARMLLAMAPPEIQAIANEGNGEEEEMRVPPQLQAQMQQMQQQIQQMEQMLDAGEAELEKLQTENQQLKTDKGLETAKLAAQMEADESNEAIDRYKAETERIKVVGDLASKFTPAPVVPPVPDEDEIQLLPDMIPIGETQELPPV